MDSEEPKEQDVLSEDVIESLGDPQDADGVGEKSHEPEGSGHSGKDRNETLSVQKRLKQVRRAHDREMREMQSRMDQLQSQLSQGSSQQQMGNPYADGMQQQGMGMQPQSGMQQPGSVEDIIQRAVTGALGQRDMAERQQKEARNQAFLQKQYRELSSHLDSMGDQYDDFHDTVLGEDAGFTPAMRDYALTLPKKGPGSAGEVLYKLGKDPALLDRISKLHPLQQAAEMSALSQFLVKGGEPEKSSPEMMGNIKSNPVSHSRNAVTDRTPVSEIRARMKAGRW